MQPAHHPKSCYAILATTATGLYKKRPFRSLRPWKVTLSGGMGYCRLPGASWCELVWFMTWVAYVFWVSVNPGNAV